MTRNLGIISLFFIILQFSSSLSNSQHQSNAITAANHPKSQEEAFVTLIYSDDFVLPVRVLGHSLKKTETKRDLVVVVAGDVSNHNLATLAADGWRIYRTEAIQNPSLWTQNGGRGHPQRFWGVYTKLMIFNLTNTSQSRYKRVVYLDADTVAARNIDELFLCDAALCAVLRHSERFNSGVMVLEPSEDMLKDMLQRISTIPSYTGGDQGFLNEYFSEFPSSPLFDPSASFGKTFSNVQQQNPWKDSKGRTLARLPTIYNADLGLYVANSNRWMLPRDKIGVIHYTLATFKPWQWYSSWILSENGRHWQSLRAELPVYKLGKDGDLVVVDGQSQKTANVSAFLVFSFLGPWLLSLLMVRRWCWNQGLKTCIRCWMGCVTRGKISSTTISNTPAARLFSQDHPRSSLPLAGAAAAAATTPFFGFDAVSALAGVASFGVALYAAVVVVIPIQIEPNFGWVLAYEWIIFLTLSLYASYLGFCFKSGQRMQTLQASGGSSRNNAAPSTASTAAVGATSLMIRNSTSPPSLSPRYMSVYSSKKEDGEVVFVCGRRPWGESLVACSVLVATLGLLPWWTDIVGVTSFTGKVIGTAAGGAISTAVCMQCFIYLAQLWFVSGTLEKCTAPAPFLAGSSSLLPILSSGKD